ncbi:MAG: hypothetical protein KGJ60_06740 [Verrucomicrobiota bacterium]|nr:hypothetical protein [Verrucomicrobiota bacterium]
MHFTNERLATRQCIPLWNWRTPTQFPETVFASHIHCALNASPSPTWQQTSTVRKPKQLRIGIIDAYVLTPMTYREALRHKSWLNLIPVTLPLLNVMGRLRNALKNQIPEGYQDETGFHFGVKHAEEQPSWPSFW